MTKTALSRRGLILTGAATAIGLSPAAAAAGLLTPRQSMGPFYPDRLPDDRDNDLVRIQGSAAQALGEIAHVRGRLVLPDGRPVQDAQVEIWQCDARGRYIHSADARRGLSDDGFQGSGQTRTAGDGSYVFRTIKPVPYPGRAPHIHFKISGPGIRSLVTQMYVEGAPGNERDRLLNSIRDPEQRTSLIVPFKPAPDIEDGALGARFDIVVAGA